MIHIQEGISYKFLLPVPIKRRVRIPFGLQFPDSIAPSKDWGDLNECSKLARGFPRSRDKCLTGGTNCNEQVWANIHLMYRLEKKLLPISAQTLVLPLLFSGFLEIIQDIAISNWYVIIFIFILNELFFNDYFYEKWWLQFFL